MRQVAANVKNPDVALLSAPVGVDSVIQTLQQSFSTNLTWLEKSFGRAYTFTRKNPEKDRIISNNDIFFPACYQGTDSSNRVKDFVDLLVNDNLDSYSFFRTNTNEEAIDYQNHVRNFFQREISAIFWFDMDRINKQTGATVRLYPFQEELNQQIKQIIETTVFSPNDSVQILRVIDDPREIFREYTIDIVDLQNLTYPRWGYRYDLLATYAQECFT